MPDTSPSSPDETPGPHVTVVGIGADGALAAEARRVVEHAGLVLGGRRQLDLLPDVPGQLRRAWPAPLRAGTADLLAQHGGLPVVALASGDPLLSGIATTLVDLLGAERVDVLPAVSSVALARAAMRWPAESHAVVSVVGRDVALVRRELAPGRRILVLSSDEHTPGRLVDVLVEAGYGSSTVTVLGDLGTDRSRVHRLGPAASVREQELAVSRLNVVALECAGPHLGGWTPGLPDTAFEHDGQLTKRDLRAAALARLAPVPGEHLWDVGAGAGSVGIEWMRAHATCTATAIEGDAQRAERIGRNASRLGVPGLQVVVGRAPQALAGLRAPDAVFVGGGATVDGVLDACLAALRPGGRLVVHGVTLETEQLLGRCHAEHGGELTRTSIETAAPIGSFTGWTPARAVTQWALTR
ncbi:precorrin-6y C5,15-methyltransferase (decarboxylating) subunit CbiE [Nocardioides aquiterrae]|uniref:Bifunctional cobalt-precorrin-7 (C(5))-methyltransferase/cobalt-precorrin-6B (C(15))-methyltransferase n=1 Tax=Nocardioides aquiterrae TaxID=203799 RepID=A0ABP4EW98_9ACTN